MRAVDYADLGRYLHDVRESQGIGIEQAAVYLHIRAKYLLELEEGKLDNMPGRAYIRGYIKNYAEYLRLDSAEILREYDNLLSRRNQGYFVPEAIPERHVPSLSTVWLSLMGLAALYAYWYNAFYERPPLNGQPFSPLESHFPAMDAAWKRCLEEGDNGCFIRLHLRENDAPRVLLWRP